MGYIISELDEQEREESFRLKRFKQLKYKNVKPKSTDTEKSEEEPICCLLKEEEPTEFSPPNLMIQSESEKIIPPVDQCCGATIVPPPPKVEPIIPPTPKVDPCSCASKVPPPPKVKPIMPPLPKVEPCSCSTKMPPPKEEKPSPTATQERLDHLMKHLNEILQIAKELQASKQTPRLESFIKCCDEVKAKIKDLSSAPSPRDGPKVCSATPSVVSREPSVSSKQPTICIKPSEKPSICSKPSEAQSAVSTQSVTPSAQLKVQSDVFELEPVNKKTLGEFEKTLKEKIKVTRTRNPDGSISEEKQIITIQTETRTPRLEKDSAEAKSPCGSGGQYSRGKRGDGSGRGKKRDGTVSPSCTSKTSRSQTPSRTSKFSGSRTPSCTSKTSESRTPTSTCTCNVSRVTNGFFSSGMSRAPSETSWTQVASKPIENFKPCGTPNQSEISKRCKICGASMPSKTAKPCGTLKPSDTSESPGTPEPCDTSKPFGTPKSSETSKPCEPSKPSDTSKPYGTPKPIETCKPRGASKSSVTAELNGAANASESFKLCGCSAPSVNTTPSGIPNPNISLKPCGCPETVPSKASATRQSSDTCSCGLSCFRIIGSYMTPTSYPLPKNEQSSCVVSPERLMRNTCPSTSTVSSLLGSTTCSSIVVSVSENQSKELLDWMKTKFTFKSESTSAHSFFQNLAEKPLKKPEKKSAEKPAENPAEKSAEKPAESPKGKHSGDKSTYCIPNCGAIRIGKNASTQSKYLFAIASLSPSTTSNSLKRAKAGQSDCTRTSSNTIEDSTDSVTVVKGSRLNALRKMILPSVNSMDCLNRGIASVSSVSSLQALFQLNPECLTDIPYTQGMYSCGSQSVSGNITPEPKSCAVLAECKAAVSALAEHLRNAGSFSPNSSNISYPTFEAPTCFKDAMTSPTPQNRKDSNPFEALFNDQDHEWVGQRLCSSSTDTRPGNEQDQCDLVHKISSSSI